MGYDFDVRTLDTDESYPDELPAETVAEYLARKKAHALRETLAPGELLLASDTTVVLEGRVYNKPADYEDALRILGELSGKTHTVYTGVCLLSLEFERSFTEASQVFFKPIGEAAMRFYLDRYQPYDKAGSYATQEWIGLTHIERIEGSYTNIMGLPTQRLYDELKALGC
jgi:septum formation protein